MPIKLYVMTVALIEECVLFGTAKIIQIGHWENNIIYIYS